MASGLEPRILAVLASAGSIHLVQKHENHCKGDGAQEGDGFKHEQYLRSAGFGRTLDSWNYNYLVYHPASRAISF
jgi:hypothetical protein